MSKAASSLLLTVTLTFASTLAAQSPPPAIAPDKSDPLYQSKGDHERGYKLPETNGSQQLYRVYVPAAWTPAKHMPLVVLLHGANLDHNAAFDREPAGLKGVLQREADKHGFILAAPEGYHGGPYGSPFPLPISQTLRPGPGPGLCNPDGTPAAPVAPTPAAPPPGPSARPIDPTAPEIGPNGPPRPCITPDERARNSQLAELDVLHVISVVSAEYNTDPRRLYLMGNSMGMHGTMALAVKYNSLFTAIGPSDGPVDPTLYPYAKLKGIAGVMITHGENDPVAPIDDSEVMAYLIQQQGIDTRFERVPGGGHGDSWYKRVPQIFDFYDQHPHR